MEYYFYRIVMSLHNNPMTLQCNGNVIPPEKYIKETGNALDALPVCHK